ncbi:MAG: aspartate kinase [Alphaproteobacteria bacterium]|nr:aspartate kinase [Alphaproteobacteria bacterium]
MRVVVQKYGGSSVSDLDKIRAVADRIAATAAGGVGVVVVVSAMGNTTNELIALANELSPDPDRRELDMLISVGERISMALLAMALRDRGVQAVSLTGSQSGIITTESHADARVVEVRPARVQQCLDDGKVVIVAGFQGVSRAREVTTLGRGGSDTTAVVLAAALKAEHCEICSDVDGVFSADPRIVASAKKLDTMGLDEALGLARAGAKVLFEDAVQYARDHGVELKASATFGPGSGTRIVSEAPARSGAVAVTSDVLERIRPAADDLARVVAAGARPRRAIGGGVWLDTKNLHGRFPAVQGERLPAIGVVSAVGSGFGERVADVFAMASELGGGACEFGASGDVGWWVVEPADVPTAVRAVHDRLVG